MGVRNRRSGSITKPDPAREQRIAAEMVVDAYGADERAMGWYHYLDDQLQFPFAATCVAKRQISPVPVSAEVDVMGMARERECRHEMFVLIRWERDGLAVPLSQLRPIGGTDEQTIQAVEDWHYWIKMGYEF